MSNIQVCCIEGIMGAIGAVIGIGKFLSTDSQVSPRRLIGRAITSAGIAIGAGAVLFLIPKVPDTAVIGLSAALATLGVDGVERILVKHWNLERRRDRT